jgi:hypothetical protein
MRLPQQAAGANRAASAPSVIEPMIIPSALAFKGLSYGDTTTPERCRACGCRYDGGFACYCPTEKRRRCAAGASYLPRVLSASRYT